MTCHDILKNWLTENGYDGLCSSGGECACDVDDFVPCGADPSNCEPGHKAECDCAEEHSFHIVIPSEGEPK